MASVHGPGGPLPARHPIDAGPFKNLEGSKAFKLGKDNVYDWQEEKRKTVVQMTGFHEAYGKNPEDLIDEAYREGAVQDMVQWRKNLNFAHDDAKSAGAPSGILDQIKTARDAIDRTKNSLAPERGYPDAQTAWKDFQIAFGILKNL